MRTLQESLARRGLRKMADWLCKHPWRFCFPQLVLVLACAVYAVNNLKFSTDRNDLVSAQEQYRRNFLQLKQEFGLPDLLVVAVESESADKNRRFMERLAARLPAESNLITRVHFKGDLKLMGPKALLFLPEELLVELQGALQTNRALIRVFSQATNLNEEFELVNRQFRRQRTAPGGPTGENPLALAVPTLQRLVDLASESVMNPETLTMPGIAVLFGANQGVNRYGGYAAFASGQIQVLTAEAATPELEVGAIRKLRELVGQIQIEVPGVNVGITGESVLRQDEMAQARHDTTAASVISLVFAAMILIWGYDDIRRPLLATFCLLVGMGFTFGFATLTVGRLNLLSITLVPILIGLAIDFGVHLISRYEEELRREKDSWTAMRTALGYTGMGIFTSALTTACAFFTMMLADLRGIQQMGLIAGAGLLVCLVPMMTLLPVLLVRTTPKQPDRRVKRVKPIPRSPMLLSLEFCVANPRAARGKRSGRDRIEQAFLKRPWTVLGCGVAFTLFTFLHLPKVHFDFNLQNLQTRNLPAIELEKKLMKNGFQSVLSCSVIANSLTEAAALEEKIRRLPSVAGVTSLVKFLTEDQEGKLALVHGIKQEIGLLRLPVPDTRPVDLRKLEQTLFGLESYASRAVAGLQERGNGMVLGIQLLSLRDSVRRLRTLVAQDAPGTAASLAAFQQSLFRDLRDTLEAIGQQDDRGRLLWEEVPPFLRERYLSPSGRFRLQVYPKEDIWQRDMQEQFVRELRTVDPNVTGSPVQFYESTSRLKESFQKAAGYALAIVALLVFLHFRRIDAMLLALLPVLLGFGWMLGLMGWIGIPFNPINIASLALVVGVGVTNGVHVLNRFAEESNPVVVTKSTGKAVVISAMTTMAGFGSLMVAKHQGIASLGAVMSIGTVTCMIAALLLLPTILSLLGRMGWSLRPRTSPSIPDESSP